MIAALALTLLPMTTPPAPTPVETVAAFRTFLQAEGVIVEPTSVACSDPAPGTATATFCYGVVIPGGSVVAYTAPIGTTAFTEVVTTSAAPTNVAAAPTTAAPPTTVAPALHRDAELAVRACMDSFGPLYRISVDISVGDDSSLIAAQAACDAAYAQLEVENSQAAADLNLCVAEMNLVFAGMNFDFTLTGTVDQEGLDQYTLFVDTNYYAMDAILRGLPATCNDDFTPSL